MIIFGYARVSMEEQNLDMQVDALIQSLSFSSGMPQTITALMTNFTISLISSINKSKGISTLGIDISTFIDIQLQQKSINYPYV